MEITLTTWWHQMTKEERLEFCLCVFFLVLAGSKKHPRVALRVSFARIFKRQLQTLGEPEIIMLLTFTCLHWDGPRDIITIAPQPPHTHPLSTKMQIRNESIAGGMS